MLYVYTTIKCNQWENEQVNTSIIIIEYCKPCNGRLHTLVDAIDLQKPRVTGI